MNKSVWVGIDVGKETFYAAAADDTAVPREWACLPAREFKHTAEGVSRFVAWVHDLGWSDDAIAGICIEATGRYGLRWFELLGERLSAVSMVNPARPKAYGQSLGIRDKSDRVDACVMALYGKAMQPQPTPPASPVQKELRELVRLHHALQVQCQANRQRLVDGPSSTIVRTVLQRTIAALRRQMDILEKAIDKLIRDDETLSSDCKRAQTVTGIGPKTATVILAEFGDLRAYTRGELVALAGLYPREYTSGTSVRKKSRLAKAGKPSVRAALYMGAMSAIRSDPHLRQFAERLKANGKSPMQILAAVMRKLLLLVRAVIVTQVDYHPHHCDRVQSCLT